MKDGFDHQCKDCVRARQKSSTKYREYQKRYRAERVKTLGREKINEYHREYYKNNKDKFLSEGSAELEKFLKEKSSKEYHKKYRKVNSDRINAYNREYRRRKKLES